MLTGAAVFFLLLLAVLAMPITLRFRVSWHEAFHEDVELRWAFGLIRVRVPSGAKRSGRRAKRHEHKAHAAKPSRKRWNVVGVLRQAGFRRRMIEFVGDLWSAVHKRDLTLRIRVGLGDPADTGQLWAIVGPAAGLLTLVQGASIRIEPEFVDPTFELDSSGSIRLIPLQMLYLFISLLLSPPIWRGMRALRAAG